MTHTHITRYRHGDGPEHVELLDYDHETGGVTRRALDESDRVDGIKEDFEIIGLAEDYGDPATVWLVAEHIHSDDWAIREVTDNAGKGYLSGSLREE